MPLSPVLSLVLLLLAAVLGALLLKRVLFWVGIRIAHRLAAKRDRDG